MTQPVSERSATTSDYRQPPATIRWLDDPAHPERRLRASLGTRECGRPPRRLGQDAMQELVLRQSRPFRKSEELAWTRLACRALRYARVLWRLSALLNTTWLRLARGVLRFERVRLAAAHAQAAYEKLRGDWWIVAWRRLSREVLRSLRRRQTMQA